MTTEFDNTADFLEALAASIRELYDAQEASAKAAMLDRLGPQASAALGFVPTAQVGAAAYSDQVMIAPGAVKLINLADDTAGAISDAQTSADGKNTITYSNGTPSGSGTRAGDTWWQFNGSAQVIGQWRWSGSAWVAQTIENALIANIDAAKITTGYLAAARIAAGSIATEKLDLTDDYGSTILTAEGFGPAWADFIRWTLYNSMFVEGTNVTPLPLGRGVNLPYWTVSKSGSPTLSLDADAAFPGARKVNFAPSALSDTMTLTSDMIPVVAFAWYNPGVVEGSAVTAGGFVISMAWTWYKADGVTAISSGSEPSVCTPLGNPGPNQQWVYAYGGEPAPANARFVVVSATIQETTPHNAANRCYLGGVFLAPCVVANQQP